MLHIKSENVAGIYDFKAKVVSNNKGKGRCNSPVFSIHVICAKYYYILPLLLLLFLSILLLLLASLPSNPTYHHIFMENVLVSLLCIHY